MSDRKKSPDGAAIKLLLPLIEAMRWGQPQRISEASESIVSAIEESHPAVAKKLRALTANSHTATVNLAAKVEGLVHFEEAGHGFEAVVLPAAVEAECRAIIEEHHRRNELASFSLNPRHRVLLHGAPGNGKTLLAEALAHELGVPFLRVRYGRLIGSLMGETGRNLDLLMEYAATAPCVLFLDEFDVVGMDRHQGGDVGEARRITNQLLIILERLPSTCMFLAATNANGLIDKALLRRFDFVIEIPSPGVDLQRQCAARELAPTLTPGHDVSKLAERVASLGLDSLYEVVELCRRIRRDLVLQQGGSIDALLGNVPSAEEVLDRNGVQLVADPFKCLPEPTP
ncbi:MAG: AAA family ATPase [Betaproteobacteria bacterium]|nr:AAA family ATPase [Betaproteobacteria bacterium]